MSLTPTTGTASSSGSLSWRLLAREWRSGELGILLAALVLAVSVVVGVSSFVDRLQSALLSESARFLAADMVVVSRTPIPEEWIDQAEQMTLQTSLGVGFPSMAVADVDHMALVSVKAVSAGYPLRGELLWSDEAYGDILRDGAIPEQGEVWLAPRLFALLGLTTGDTLMVGEASLTVTGAVRGEPDATTAVFGFGPRLLMNTLDIPSTGVVQPGSRVGYRLLLSGNRDRVSEYEAWVSPLLGQGQRLDSVEGSQPRIGDTLDRARGFLLLAGSLAVVLAAAAITLASRRFGERHTQYVAILKSLGAQSHDISRLYATSLGLMGAAGTAMGCLLGWILQEAFIRLLGSLLPVTPGAAGVEPVLIGAVTAMVCILFFAWPPLRRLGEASPLRVLRADIGMHEAQRPQDFLFGGLSIIGLMWWYSGSVAVTLAVVSGLAVVMGLGFLAARGLLSGGRRVGGFAGSIWRVALAGLQRRGRANALQMVIFAMAIMLMLLLSVVRSSLIGQWQAQLPADAPNHFLLNLAPEERPVLEQFFTQRGVATETLYPMTRGRIFSVNAETLPEWEEAEGEDAPRQREANFTWSDELPTGNMLVAGDWWEPEDTTSWVSLEEDFAAGIGASVGDRLSMRIGADTFDAEVRSIRKVDWQSMRPNFFVVFPRAVLERYPGMYMTSFRLLPTQKPLLNELVRELPTVTVIELDIVIKEMRSVVDQVARALELVLAVILVAGSLVLISGVRSSLDARLKESALMRALGARQRLVLGTLWIEFLVLGGLAGALASVGAEVAAWGLQTRVFDMNWAPTVTIWWLGPTVGAVIVGALGVWSCRRVVRVPPIQLLREV
ncbi:MAG: FtsX-like permease family protein [Proteobacteria bacterium]|nr:FtsX-like permease family protein [Pseudomonadota bacterium]